MRKFPRRIRLFTCWVDSILKCSDLMILLSLLTLILWLSDYCPFEGHTLNIFSINLY